MSTAPSYFGRAWSLAITLQATGESWTIPDGSGGEVLKCTFDIEQQTNSAYWFADIAVYNFLPSMAKVIQQGDAVTLTAGYNDPGSGVIFTGTVYQPLWERANETDYKLTLHCLVGLFEDQLGKVQTTIAAGLSQAAGVRQVVAAVNAANPGKPVLRIEALDPSLETKPYPRGVPVSGLARLYFDQVAIDNQMQCWIGWNGLNIRPLYSDSDTPDIIYAPPYSQLSNTETSDGATGGTKYTLIGTPQQTQLGVNFRTLLDSKVGLGQLVKLENVLAQRLPQIPNQFQALYFPDGLYIIAGIRHRGDTRSNDWYTDIIAVVPNWSKILNALQKRRQQQELSQ